MIFLLVLGGSCLDNGICLRGADNGLVINFKKLSDGLEDTVTLQNIEALGTNGVFYLDDPDTVNIIPSSGLSSDITLLVNPYADSTRFTFNNIRGDTLILTVGYKTEIRFVSEECGSERLQYDLKVLRTTFDSVRVVRRNLDKGRFTNIEIYN